MDVKALLQKNQQLTKEVQSLRRVINQGSGSMAMRRYIEYLEKEKMTIERQWAEQQGVIDQYMAHFAKYGHFYTEYQQRLLDKEKSSGTINHGLVQGDVHDLQNVQEAG